MPGSIDDELKRAEILRDDGKYTKMIELIEQIEEQNALTEKQRLWCLIYRGQFFGFTRNFAEAIKIGTETYEMRKN